MNDIHAQKQPMYSFKKLKSFVFLMVLVSGSANGSADCAISPEQIQGDWRRTGETGFFEEFSLKIEKGNNIFNSWLHQRPEIIDAGWHMEECILTVAGKDTNLGPFRFKVLAVDNNTLMLLEQPGDITSQYVAIQ